MSVMFVAWPLIVGAIAVSLACLVPLPRNASLAESKGLTKRGDGRLAGPAAAFLVVAGLGLLHSFVLHPLRATGAGDEIAASAASTAGDDTFAQLAEYVRSFDTDEPSSKTAEGDPLPDVETMIGRLAARLESNPGDARGWRMLAWAYFNVARYDDSVRAYAKAVELDPNSPDIKRAYDEAKSKVADGKAPNGSAPATQTVEAGKSSGAAAHAEGSEPRRRPNATHPCDRWSIAWRIAWAALPGMSRAGPSSCALGWFSMRSPARQRRSGKRSRFSRTTL